ncbi:MAG: signal peptidase I [Candidatus Berkelbacteria bacterium]|nr:signal peptidase I [Candidatus Berkelbacteria bacterium]
MDETKEKIEQPQSESLNKITPGGEKRTVSFLSFFFDLLKTFVIVVIVAFSIRFFVVQPFVVDGDSMLPNFINNEYLIAEKVSYDFKEPSRGDVVIFRYPKNPSVIYIKRLIGLPGETIEIKDNKVFVASSPTSDEKVLDESGYLPVVIKTYPLDNIDKSVSYKITLADNEFFVLGDNREHSSDSREWGVLPKANIIGRVLVTVSPLDHFKIFTHLKYSGISQ